MDLKTKQAALTLIRERVQAAVTSGKLLTRGMLAEEYEGDDYICCCAIGAFALNGDDFPSQDLECHDSMSNEEAWAITGPILRNVGVPEDEIGHVLDALERGFESNGGGFYSAPWRSRDTEWPYEVINIHAHCVESPYHSFFLLGAEIFEEHGHEE